MVPCTILLFGSCIWFIVGAYDSLITLNLYGNIASIEEPKNKSKPDIILSDLDDFKIASRASDVKINQSISFLLYEKCVKFKKVIPAKILTTNLLNI